MARGQGWFKNVEAEIAALPDGYEALLVARPDGEVAGCVALKRLWDGACEMKRLYVRPARAAPAWVAITTWPRRGRSTSLGFQPVERYNENPIAGVLFFELQL